jgi:hypothetical protein
LDQPYNEGHNSDQKQDGHDKYQEEPERSVHGGNFSPDLRALLAMYRAAEDRYITPDFRPAVGADVAQECGHFSTYSRVILQHNTAVKGCDVAANIATHVHRAIKAGEFADILFWPDANVVAELRIVGAAAREARRRHSKHEKQWKAKE